MKRNSVIQNTLLILVSGTIRYSAFAGDQLSSPVDDGSFDAAQRQQMLLQTLMDREPVHTPSEAKAGGSASGLVSAAPAPTLSSASEEIPMHRKQGNISGGSAAKIKQTYKSSAAREMVEQGNIVDSTISGDIDQEFN